MEKCYDCEEEMASQHSNGALHVTVNSNADLCKEVASRPLPPSFSVDIFPFLRLPSELRLVVYSHCSVFTILNLTHTSPFLSTEINSSPSLVRNSYGYALPRAARSARWFMSYAYWLETMAHPHCLRYGSKRQQEADRAGLEAPFEKLRISDIYCVGSEEEMELFDKRFMKGSFEKHVHGRKVVCRICWRVGSETCFMESAPRWMEGESEEKRILTTRNGGCGCGGFLWVEGVGAEVVKRVNREYAERRRRDEWGRLAYIEKADGIQ